jgi:hypothetical protein
LAGGGVDEFHSVAAVYQVLAADSTHFALNNILDLRPFEESWHVRTQDRILSGDVIGPAVGFECVPSSPLIVGPKALRSMIRHHEDLINQLLILAQKKAGECSADSQTPRFVKNHL